MASRWNPNGPNSVQLDDGRVIEIPAGISASQAYESLVEAGAISPYDGGEEEDRSGFFPGMFSSIENIKGTFTGALPATAAGLGITGTEEQRKKYLEASQAIYEASREAQMEELPDPASIDSIKEAYQEGGAWDALAETWDFSKEAVGQQVPIFGGLMAAQKLGGSRIVSNSFIGRAATAILGRAIPAAVAPYMAASFSNPYTGAAAALALSAAFAYASMLRDNAESAEDLEDIKVLRAATAAAPHAAMEYLGFAMTGAFGPLKQQLAAATLKDTLAGASTIAGRSAWGAAGRQAAKSLTEFPTELAQTIIERAQAGESISPSDADFVTEMINVAAATAPVVGVFGGYGGYRAYKNEKSNKQTFDKKTEIEKAHRASVAEARRIEIERQEENARRLADEGVARYEAAVGAARARDEGIARQVEQMAQRTPVEYADIIEALDSRGVTPDNVFSAGVAAFIFRNTDGKVSSLHGLKDSPSLSKAERDQRARYRRRIYSILSGMGSFEYVGADKDAPLTFNEYTTEQFDKVLKATRKFKGKAPGTRINTDNIRKILKMGNSGVENQIAAAIKRDLKLDGYSEQKGRVDVARNPGYTEIQYREIMDRARENGRLSQEIYEQVTNNYGREYYAQFVEDALVRGSLDPVQAKKNIYVPMRAQKGIGYVDVEVESDTPGYFIRHDGEIVGGATTRAMAEQVVKSLQHRSRSYTVTKNGQTFKTYKNKAWADQAAENEREVNPDDTFEVVSNPVATFEIDKTKTPGFRVVERFRDEEGNVKDIYEDSFSPTREIAEGRKKVREDEYSVGESAWDRRADKRREQAMQDLFYGPRERGLYQDPVLEDFLPKEPELTEQEARVVDLIDAQLKDLGVSDFRGKVEERIRTGDRVAAGEFSPLFRTISVALDQFGGAQTDAEIDKVLREVVDHEVIHAMRELDLFSENEWLALSRSVARIRIPKSMRDRNRELFDENTTFLEWAEKNYEGTPTVEALKRNKNPDAYWDYIVEEAVAELHSSYKSSPEVSDQVDGTSESLLDKVRRFFERVYNSVTGVGYGDAGDVFAAIGKGTIGGRKRGEIRTFKTGPKYASVDQLTRPRSERERRDSDLNETRGGVAVETEEDQPRQSLVPPPSRYNSSVQINGDWSDMILNREKTVETSGQSMVKNGGAPGWVLLRDETGQASGAALLGKRFEYKSKEEFDSDFDRHRVSSSSEFAFGKRSKTYGYPVEDVVRFEEPVPVNTPRGQNRKKNLTYSVIPNIDIEGSRYSLSRTPATFDEDTGLWSDGDFTSIGESVNSYHLIESQDQVPTLEDLNFQSGLLTAKGEEAKPRFTGKVMGQDVDRKGIVGKTVRLRIDIPFFNSWKAQDGRGKYVVTIHDDKTKSGKYVEFREEAASSPGAIIGYDSIARLSGPVRFGSNGKKAAQILREGVSKNPIASVEGKYVDDQSIPEDIDSWTPVGYDPHKATFFYDKRTGDEIISGEDAISIGNTVFVKNVDPWNEETFEKYSEGLKTPKPFRQRRNVMRDQAEWREHTAAMREAGEDFTASLPEPNEQFGQEFLQETLEQTRGFVPRISSRPDKNLDLRPEVEDRRELKQRSIDIANGVIDPVKFSLADKENSNPRRKRRAGNMSYEELKARTVPERTEKTFIDTLKEIWQEKTLAMWRQKFIDKYDSIAKLSRRAAERRMQRGDDHMLLANVNAASAAYLSDNVQGIVAESITSGQPVYQGGIVRVDYDRPGVFEIMKDVYQQGLLEDFHLWLISKRSHRLNKDNKLVPVSEDEIAEIEAYVDSQPGMRQLFERTNEQYQEWNENLVNFLRDTGVIDERLGEVLKSYGDYVPFYRQYEGEAYEDESEALSNLIGQSIEQMKTTVDPRTGETIVGEGPISGRVDPLNYDAPNSMFGSLVNVKPPKRLRREGSDEMVVPMLEGIMKNLQAAVSSGANNIAAQRTLRDALVFGDEIAVKLDRKSDAEFASDVVTVRENGVDQHYQLKDKLLFDSLSGMMEGKMPWLSLFSQPSDVLRNLVTRSPDFIMANLMRDSISTWVTSGSKMAPMIGTFGNFFKGGIGVDQNQDPSLKNLMGAGVIGGYDNARYAKDLQKTFDKRMRAEGLTVSGKKRGIADKAVFNTMQKLWDWSGDITTKSDAATRMAVYEDVYKNILSKGHTREEAEAEAIFQAQEVINFSRRGNSSFARVVTAAIPFLNARVQGLDVLWRAGRGNYSSDYSKAGQKASMLSFLGRGSMLASLTGMYALMAHDEDEWLAASPAEQDDNWIIPGYGDMPGFKIPIPFEIGIIFKVIPERLMRASLSGENYFGVNIPEGGKTDWRQAGDAIARGVTSSLKFNPFEAQVTKPLLEAYVNYSFFTGQPIVPIYMEGKLAEKRKRNGTNAMAVALGETFGASPLKIEHIMRGYTGTVGSWVMFASDAAIRSMSNMPAKPALRVDQWPLLRRFLQTDLGSQGQLSNFYEFRSETRKFVNSLNDAIKEGDVETQKRILERYPKVESIQDYMNQMDRELGELRRYQSQVYLSDMSPEKKLDIINRIEEQRKLITKDVTKLRIEMDLPFNPLADF